MVEEEEEVWQMMEMIEEEVEVEVVEERQDSWNDGVKWARMYAKTLRWW